MQILLVVLLLALTSVVIAQTPVTPCATVDVDGPSEVDPNTPVVFKAKITDISPPGCELFTSIPFSEVKFTKPRPKSLKKRR